MSATPLLLPWQRVEAILGGMQDNAKSWFRDVQRAGDDLSGLVIARWDDEGSEQPTHYLAKYNSGRYLWCCFGDEGEEEAPYIFIKLSAALERMVKERKELEWWYQNQRGVEPKLRHIGLALWVHPEADYVPLEQYEKIIGVRFPGCPRR